MNESDTLSVFCNASGNPAPTITWRKVGASGSSVTSGNTMEITNVSHEKDSGFYECIASNIVQSDTGRFKITVNCK